MAVCARIKKNKRFQQSWFKTFVLRSCWELEILYFCIVRGNFANENNVTHIIFSIEGTYVIDVNKILMNIVVNDNKTFKKVRKNIQEIFKLTHKHRMYYNDSNSNISLEHEFNNIFLIPLQLKEQKNILLSWLYLVNNLTLRRLIKLSAIDSLCVYQTV